MANVNEKVESLHGLRAEALISICSDCFSLEPIVNQKMKNAKKVLITSATSEIFIMRRGGQRTVRGFCEICEAETEMLDLHSAVTVFGLGTRELIRQIETGAVHSGETASGHLLVCTESLQTTIRETK